MEASSKYELGNNWAKETYDDAKSYCESEGKELAYFEDEASFDKFFAALYINYDFWVDAKIVTIDGSRKYRVCLFSVTSELIVYNFNYV